MNDMQTILIQNQWRLYCHIVHSENYLQFFMKPDALCLSQQLISVPVTYSVLIQCLGLDLNIEVRNPKHMEQIVSLFYSEIICIEIFRNSAFNNRMIDCSKKNCYCYCYWKKYPCCQCSFWNPNSILPESIEITSHVGQLHRVSHSAYHIAITGKKVHTSPFSLIHFKYKTVSLQCYINRAD